MLHSQHFARWATRLRRGSAFLVLLPLLGACDAERSTSPDTAAPAESLGEELVAAPDYATAAASSSCSTSGATRVVQVSSGSALSSALSNARAGDVIVLANGKYSGRFRIQADGSSSKPITVCGSSSAVLDGGSTSSGYGLHLDGASYVIVKGVTITRSQKGVILDNATRNELREVTVSEMGHEGIHVRKNSTYNVIRSSRISRVGKLVKHYGEGIYFGSAESNWCTYTGCKPDASNYNQALDNVIEDVTAEGIEAKEGTKGGVIRGNTIRRTGDGASSASGAVGLRASNYMIENNNVSDVPLSGFIIYSGRDGDNNTFRGNRVDAQSSGYGFLISRSQVGNVVSCSNVVTNARQGFSNVKCSG